MISCQAVGGRRSAVGVRDDCPTITEPPKADTVLGDVAELVDPFLAGIKNASGR
jgi:hypothetical protein